MNTLAGLGDERSREEQTGATEMTDTATYAPPPSSAMAPVPYRVRSRVTENRDSATLCSNRCANRCRHRNQANS